MAGVATAASQPGVSVVSMSWGFPEGQAVFAADEANYDSVFNVPGVTFVASTGDYGTADPEYPAFSPNVVAVGGTSLNLNADQLLQQRDGMGLLLRFAGHVDRLRRRHQPVRARAGLPAGRSVHRQPDHARRVAGRRPGHRRLDRRHRTTSAPTTRSRSSGGTSLSAPAFAGLIALVNQGRVAAGEATLNSASPTETQQALYSLPQSDYNAITSGSNGYTANAGYNLVTGLGTPVANLMVPDLIAYQGPGTTYAGPTVSPLQDATLYSNWAEWREARPTRSTCSAPSPRRAAASARSRAPMASLAMSSAGRRHAGAEPGQPDADRGRDDDPTRRDRVDVRGVDRLLLAARAGPVAGLDLEFHQRRHDVRTTGRRHELVVLDRRSLRKCPSGPHQGWR